MNEKFERVFNNITNFFACPISFLRYTYDTKIYPRKVKHYWCKFYDLIDKVEKEGWYVLDKRGEMIPWVHADNGITCMYPNMITPIEK